MHSNARFDALSKSLCVTSPTGMSIAVTSLRPQGKMVTPQPIQSNHPRDSQTGQPMYKGPLCNAVQHRPDRLWFRPHVVGELFDG
jgi:hypothetical protein